ncbi:MAG: ribonuclease P protein component 4 [Nitrososphaerales archaeon]
MKNYQKDLAEQRIEILIQNAIETARWNTALAQKQAKLAKRISTKFRVRLPYEIRQLYCKKCKRFIIPGETARVRVGRANVRAIRVTCTICGHVYRKIIAR